MEFSEREMQLLVHLAGARDWVKTNELTSALNISTRTLRSVVKEINRKDNLIDSSAKGYRIRPERTTEMWDNDSHEKEKQAGSSEVRQNYIIKQFLLSNNELDYEDLVSNLFISDSTLNSDLTKLRRKLEYYGIALVRSDNSMKLIGSEKKIRRLMSDTIFNEVQDGLLNFQILDKVFPDYDISYIRSILLKNYQKYHFQVDDFGTTDMILHLCITLDRVAFNNVITKDSEILDSKIIPYFNVARSIMADLSNYVGFEIPQQEILNFAAILSVNARQIIDKNLNLKDISQIVDPTLISFVSELTNKVVREFSISINEEIFIIRFSLHLYRTLQENASINRNPMLKNIKNSYPLLFEISVYIANLTHEQYQQFQIDENNISFIALHVGMAIRKDADHIVSIALIVPNYWSLDDSILAKLKDTFFNQIAVTSTVGNEMLLDENLNYDLIVSTQPVSEKYKSKTVEISPLCDESDLSKIQKRIDQIIERKIQSNLTLRKVFNPNLFAIYNNSPKNKEEVIHALAEKLLQEGIVNCSYESQVFEREILSPTSFSNIAMPHSISQSSNQTAIAIAILKKPLLWDGNKVNTVLLLSVAKGEKSKFKILFQDAIKLFTSDQWISSINKIECFEDMEKVLNLN